MSKTSIMSLRELIDTAFGDYDKNTVNFNLIKTIMYILARQLRILERHVEVESNRSLNELPIDRNSSSLSVTEVKIQAKVDPKKGKKKIVRTESDRAIKKKDQKGGKADQGYDVAESAGEGTDEIKGEMTDDTSHGKKETQKTKEQSSRPSGIKIETDTEIDDIAKIERLLRVVNQRSDSREEGREVPTPMATPIASEKILVVKTMSQEERDKKSRMSPKISVVTQEQFEQLVKEVNQLRKKHMTFTATNIPETRELMKKLKKGASLSESIVALQLSARLEAAEKALERMISLLTYLAQNINTKPTADHSDEERQKSDSSPEEAAQTETSEDTKKMEGKRRKTWTDVTELTIDRITHQELKEILEELKLDIEKNVEVMTDKHKATCDTALKICQDLDSKLSNAMLVELRMVNLEHMVDEYTQKINTLDTSLSSQMTHYQESLTQMEHDLEAGIENMAEALANTGGDTTAISELNTHFSALALDFDNMSAAQRELRENEQIFTIDIQELWRQVECLKEVKSDRDEVEDALRDKAGLDSLNGLTTMMQFEAVRGDLEKRIRTAYEKFNSQEFTWQKIIEDFIRELNERAHIIQLESLRDEMNKYLNSLRDRLEFIANIVGEPRAAGTTRMIQRNTVCVSCSMPAHMVLDPPEVPLLPALPDRKKSPAIADEAEGAGDYKPCIPGMPIPHLVDDFRAKTCTRYCGGEHTKAAMPPPMPEKSLQVAHIPRETSLEININKKLNKVAPDLVPCRPCNYFPEEQIKKPCDCEEVCNCFSEDI